MENLDVAEQLKVAIQSLSIAGAQTAFEEPKVSRACRSIAEALVAVLEHRGGIPNEVSMTEHAKLIGKHLRELSHRE